MASTFYHVSQMLFFVLCAAFLGWLLYVNNHSHTPSIDSPLDKHPRG